MEWSTWSVRLDQLRAMVGVEDDLLVRDALPGLRLGAPLAHADPVAEAVAVGEADRGGVGHRGDETAGEGAVGRGGRVDREAELLAGEQVRSVAAVGDDELDRPAD